MSISKQQIFLELYLPIQENVERYALYLAGNRQDAKDLVSEAVLHTFANFESIKNEKALLSYMFTICYRKHLDNRKSSKKHLSSEIDLDSFVSNDSQRESNYDVELLYKALDKLPLDVKNAITLAEIFGLSHKEIAEIQNCSTVSVKVKIFRGKQKLKDLLVAQKKKQKHNQQLELVENE